MKNESILFIPMMPTPNGPLHLGHISGPYLKMDILNKHFKRIGHLTYLVGCTDPYDNYVLLKSYRIKKPPENICNYFYNQIKSDFNTMSIEFDNFSNPLASTITNEYSEVYNRILKDFIRNNKTIEYTERYLYSNVTHRKIIGCWLIGDCPFCFNSIAGYFCESCGMKVNPDNIINPSPRLGDQELVWQEQNSLFLRVQDSNLKEHIRNIQYQYRLPDKFDQVMLELLSEKNCKIRLTSLDDWGIPKSEAYEKYEFSTVYNSYLGYAIFCGDLCQNELNLSCNPFSVSSDWKTVTSLGLDNAIDISSFTASALLSEKYKPFSYCLGNFFLLLDNMKFSTSQQHAIWVNDIANNKQINTDILRLYLSLHNCDSTDQNFDTSHFIRFHNSLSVSLNQRFSDVVKYSNKGSFSYSEDNNYINQITQQLKLQSEFLDLENLDMKESAECLVDYIIKPIIPITNASSAYWWLKGFSLLAYPWMSKLAKEIEIQLASNSTPSVDQLRFRANIKFNFLYFNEIDRIYPESIKP